MSSSRTSLFASGSNAAGHLGTKTTEDHNIFAPCFFAGSGSSSRLLEGTKRILDIACGSTHTLALLEIDDGRTEVWGCGDGSKGQLGEAEFVRQREGKQDTNTSVFRRIEFARGYECYRPKLICAGWETSYVVLRYEGSGDDLKNDVLLSMGSSDWGCLGVGDTVATSKDHPKMHVVELRPILKEEDSKLASNRPLQIIDIQAGPHHIIVRVHQGKSDCDILLGWGKARHGQLGGEDHSAFDGVGKGKAKAKIPSKDPTFYETPQVVPSPFPGDSVRQVTMGAQHTVFLSGSGLVKGLGCNRKNQQAVINRIRRNDITIKAVGCTWNGTYLFCNDDRILCSGSSEKGQLGRESGTDHDLGEVPLDFPGKEVVELACGSEHVLLLRSRSDGPREVWAWGWNEHGNLGLGHTKDVRSPTRIWPASENPLDSGTVTGMWAGAGTSWITIER